MGTAESDAHWEIRNLVAAYNAFGDRGRFDELMGLFEPDAVMEIGDGHTYEGADRIREIFTRTRDSVTSGAQPSYVQHHTSPVHITMVDQDHATGRVYFSVLMEHGQDRRAHTGRVGRPAAQDSVMTFVPRTHEDSATEDGDRLDNGPAQQVCDTLLAGFVDYMTADRLLSGRASSHFAKHEWSAQEADALQRLTLHRETVWKAVDQTAGLLDDVPDRRGEWRQARNLYQRRIAERTDQGLAETFFNSVTRRIFTTIGVDNDVELRWFGATAVPRGESRTE